MSKELKALSRPNSISWLFVGMAILCLLLAFIAGTMLIQKQNLLNEQAVFIRDIQIKCAEEHISVVICTKNILLDSHNFVTLARHAATWKSYGLTYGVFEYVAVSANYTKLEATQAWRDAYEITR